MQVKNSVTRGAVLSAGLILGFFLLAASAGPAPEIDTVMDGIVERMYDALSIDELAAVDHESLWEFITPDERAVLAAKYWTFEVNVPVVVSVMRHNERHSWSLTAEGGFVRPGLTVSQRKL